MTGPVPGLRRADLSAVGRSAADVSARGQRITKRLVRWELLALVLAGAAGAHGLHFGRSDLDVLAVASGLLFLSSLGSLVYRSFTKPENSWYTGRAGMESVRTLAWRYAVGGDPFPAGLSAAHADDRYLDRLTRIFTELRELDLAPAGPDDRELTPGMRSLRAAPFTDRVAAYRRDRVADQIDWYTTKAGMHARAARRWLWTASLAAAAGAVAAGCRAIGLIDADLLGVAASCASAAIAWSQLNQNRNLVSAYRLTARELGIIRDRMEIVTEQQWAAFVSDAEDAISREHTLWLARHGHPGILRA